ncbi:hypothetical protein [Streptomyces sp. NPDC088766]|uniref:hypothetical protein n=1 Tax=Streptomyces sp. NPDC088766 TaxID=3365893 RepID=UPI0037FB039E
MSYGSYGTHRWDGCSGRRRGSRPETREYDRHRRGGLASLVTAGTALLREVVSQAPAEPVTGSFVATGAIVLTAWLGLLRLLLVAVVVAAAALVVAHRLSTARRAGHIAVLYDGRTTDA